MEQTKKYVDSPMRISKQDGDNLQCVYKITNKLNTSEFYIGSTSNLYNRIIRHISYLRYNDHVNPNLQEIYNKHDEYGLVLEIIENCDGMTNDELRDREQYYLDTLQPSMNILKDSRSWRGSKHKEETKQKISESNMGRIVTQETRDKLRATSAGKTYAPKECERFKTEYVQKIKRKVNVYTLNDEFIATWSCIVYCAKGIDAKHPHIGRVLAGNRKATRNLKFKYHDEFPNEVSIVESYDFSKMLGIISDTYNVTLESSQKYTYEQLKSICNIEDEIDEIAKFNHFLYKQHEQINN